MDEAKTDTAIVSLGGLKGWGTQGGSDDNGELLLGQHLALLLLHYDANELGVGL